MIQNAAADGQAVAPMASGHVVHQAAIAAEAHTAASVVTHVAPHIGHVEWNDAFSQKVVWMAGQQHQQADIQINPPNLGPVEVRLSLNQDQASLMFISPHAAVRDAIQSALPRLQDMMASSGLTLGNVFVGSEAAQQQAYGERQAGHGGAGGDLAGEAIGMGGVSGELYLPQHHGMVDLFA
jgi:flagellar hook-length control protein FliK